MDIALTENSCFSKIFPVLLKWFLLISNLSWTFYKMRVSWEFNIYNLFKSFLSNTVLSFSKHDVNIICG